MDNFCVLYSSSPESALHVLSECPFASMSPELLPYLLSATELATKEFPPRGWQSGQPSPREPFGRLSSLELFKRAATFQTAATPVPFTLVSTPSAMDQDQCRWGFQCHYKYWGVGDIFRDEVGSYVGSFAHKISHVTSLKMIEALAARNGVCLSWERNGSKS
ncbi:hypothetical protein D8674_022382 [Pyrus ussuriensis x Pyrus communis]|uniref:Uncharacterized protein n=1 Tax=Pyrus ussuriensis x Pyrus communis TaxID=2448454 RepID=A0A5N5GYG3_9ROSA|nr:hypothetical protein D8674_022382 [Pyrus ussuriensis x Pyrus communis]